MAIFDWVHNNIGYYPTTGSVQGSQLTLDMRRGNAFDISALLVALLPPTDWDGLFYHLTGPKLYLQAGQIVGGIDIPHLNFPSLMEMLFTWAMLLRSDIAAKLLHALYGQQ